MSNRKEPNGIEAGPYRVRAIPLPVSGLTAYRVSGPRLSGWFGNRPEAKRNAVTWNTAFRAGVDSTKKRSLK